MTEATAPATRRKKRSPYVDDPEQYRMTLGDHLEELRWRMILGLGGFALAVIVCLIYGNQVMRGFCAPLTTVLQQRDINPQLYYTEIGEPFMVYMQISLITAAAFAAPWMLYQLWLFVAAGLYPHERKFITRYIPLSVGLLISGMLFVYFLVLPWTVQFFIDWGSDVAPISITKNQVVPATQPLFTVPTFQGDPANPPERALWFNTLTGKLKMQYGGKMRVIPFGPESLIAPHIKLQDYIDMVVMMLLTFGLAFQLPLAVMALIRIGIVEVAAMKRARRVVYFVLLIVAAVITPGDVITATIALMFPLVGLYELGLFLGARGMKEEPQMDTDEK